MNGLSLRRLIRPNRVTPNGALAAVVVLLVGIGCHEARTEQPINKALAVASIKLLSERGSTRSTRYATTNKIVTVAGKTHVAWLDSISQTMVATYDDASGAWTQPVKVGNGKDNHGGPALTCDSTGTLHIIFGPHGGPFQHCRSARPNDATKWVRLPEFADQATYPSVVCDEADTLHIIYRGGPNPRKLLYQRRPKAGRWSKPRILARAPIKSGYTHYHCALTIGPDHSLHSSYDIYFNSAAKCAGHMMSRDRGRTWTLADGSPLDLPVSPKSDAFFKRTSTALKTGGIVCDSAARPWITVSGPEVWHHDGKTWRRFVPSELIRPQPKIGKLAGYGPPGIDAKDRIYVPALLDGHVVLLYSDDKAKTFKLLRVFAPDETLPHTGLSIERPTGQHAVQIPWLMFATGLKGPDCYGKGIYHKVRAVRLTR